LPTVPPELGEPNRIYLAEAEWPVLVLIWDEPLSLDTETLLLYIVDSRDVFFKFMPDEPEYTTVNGRRAVWLADPHLMEFFNQSSGHLSRAVNANVLIWEADGLTYRLEGNITLDEAVQIAESMS
jgi:uncharacterized protein DUF4367